MKSLSARVRSFHRWIGLIFSVSILMSSGSGVLHNVMTRTQSPPPQARPAGQSLESERIKVSVSDALRQLAVGSRKIQAVSIRSIGSDPWYQVILEGGGKPLYVNASTGSPGSDADEIYASRIAEDYLGGKPVKKTDYLTAFNQEYINIFRILPVYRFDAEDGKGSRVYVSTMTGSVTRYTDNSKQFEASIFTNVHKFGFISNHDLRDFLLTLVTAGSFAAALAGIILFFMTMPRKRTK